MKILNDIFFFVCFWEAWTYAIKTLKLSLFYIFYQVFEIKIKNKKKLGLIMFNSKNPRSKSWVRDNPWNPNQYQLENPIIIN